MKIESTKILLRNAMKYVRQSPEKQSHKDPMSAAVHRAPSYSQITKIIDKVVLPEVKKLIQKSKRGNQLTVPEYSRCLVICAGLCAVNQQPSRVMELQNASFTSMMNGLIECERGGFASNWIFQSNEFKTASTYKKKGIVFTGQNSKILLDWARYVRRGGSDNAFFLSSVGKKVSNYSELVGKFTYYYFGTWLTLTSLRAIMETRGVELQMKGHELDMNMLRRSDKHSSKVAKKYYQKVQVDTIARAGFSVYKKIVDAQ